MLRRLLVLIAVIGGTLGFPGIPGAVSTASAAETIKLGTLAPKDSPWGGVFKAWAKAVDDESAGALKLDWFFGTAGDEMQMVGAMKSGGLDGGALTATGLSQIYPHIIALQMPGLFDTWDKLDACREKTRAKFEAAFDAQGFKLLGTGDVGMAHLMSRGKEVRRPDDLKAMHPFYIAGDVIGQKFLETVGVPGLKSLSVPAILSEISSTSPTAINVVNSPAIAANALGWSAHVDYINADPSGIGIGALIMKKERAEQLPADVKAILERTGKNTGKLLTQRIRGIDKAAFDDLSKKKKVVTLNDEEKKVWAALFAKVRNALKSEGKIKADVFDEVVAASGH